MNATPDKGLLQHAETQPPRPRALTLALILGACLTLATGCSTVESRIRANPEVYQALTPQHQALVSNGQVDRGMPRPAVMIAWGKPHNIALGNRAGHAYETWIYNRVAFDTIPNYTYISRRIGPYISYDPIFDPVTIRQTSPYKFVSFRNDLVTDWEVLVGPAY